MNMARSSGYSALAVEPIDRSALRTIVRWAVLGAAGVIALILALSHSMSASAAAPCVQINYTTCVTPGVSYIGGNTVAYTNVNSGYPANTVVSTYYDPRYGVVSVVSDGSGNLIDVNAATGQRIYPIFPDYGYGFVAPNYVNGFSNGSYTFPNYLVANNCAPGNFSCLGYAQWAGFPFFGATGIYSGNVTVIAPSGNVIPVGPPFRPKVVAQPAAVTQPVAQPA